MKVIHENLYFKRSNFEKSSVEGTRVPASLEKVNFLIQLKFHESRTFEF